MGVIKLTVTSPVQTFDEPITLDDALTYLGLVSPDPGEPTFLVQIEEFIQGAREQAELFQRRDLVAKQWDLSLDCFPYEIQLRDPLASVDLVRYRDSDGNYHTLTENTDYIVDTAKGCVLPAYGQSWPSFTPWPSSAVLVRFTMAAPAVPSVVKVGMFSLISDWFNNKLPFGTGIDAAKGYPARLVNLLAHGARENVF